VGTAIGRRLRVCNLFDRETLKPCAKITRGIGPDAPKAPNSTLRVGDPLDEGRSGTSPVTPLFGNYAALWQSALIASAGHQRGMDAYSGLCVQLSVNGELLFTSRGIESIKKAERI
jgi:hypothetical protein